MQPSTLRFQSQRWSRSPPGGYSWSSTLSGPLCPHSIENRRRATVWRVIGRIGACPCPPQPARRAVSLAALAAAGCGGIYYVARSGLLKGREDFPVKPWQVRYRLLPQERRAGGGARYWLGIRLCSGRQGGSWSPRRGVVVRASPRV